MPEIRPSLRCTSLGFRKTLLKRKRLGKSLLASYVSFEKLSRTYLRQGQSSKRARPRLRGKDTRSKSSSRRLGNATTIKLQALRDRKSTRLNSSHVRIS